MQHGTKRSMRTQRHGLVIGPFSDGSKDSGRKTSRPAVVSYSDARRSYERYVVLARAAASTGDAVETENLYQHAEHYFRLMREPVILV